MFAHRVTMILSGALALSGCQLEKLFPDKVAAGAARLSVRNAVKIVSLIDDDTACGMQSAAVLQAYRQDGELGTLGSVTWTVEGCVLELGKNFVSKGSDCNGSETTARGRLVVTAEKTVKGLLTGNPQRPVIPQSPDAVTFHIAADATDYEIRLSDKITGLVVQKGHVDIAAAIHLAQSASSGICSVSTADATLSMVKYRDALFTLDDGERVFDVDVPSLDVEAQLGVYGDFENYIDGVITVWDTEVDLASDQWLDPDYEAGAFRDAYSCKEDITTPVTYECLPLTPKLAVGAAKLTVNNVGNLMSAIVSDESCGFASAAVISAAQLTGDIGKEGGEVVYRIDIPCVIDLATKTVLARDCLGETTYAQGKASVTGTMKVRGRRSGDPLLPIIPTSRDPAEIAFNIAFDRWRVSDDASDQSLEVTGDLSGRMQPRMALDTITGACSIATPVITFEDLAYQPGTRATVRADGNALGVDIDGSALDAQNGNKDGRENRLEGYITVDGEVFSIPITGDAVLDPGYDAAAFQATYTCAPNMLLPASDDECNFHQVIGDGAARLVVQSVGTLASMVNSDSNCGFEDQFGVLISPSEVIGDVGDMGSMTWDIEGCNVGADELSVQAEDCIGGAVFVQGHADVDATRTVEGERTTKFFFIDAIEPRDNSSVHIWLNDVRLSEFVAYPLAAGQSTPLGKLTIHEGTLTALVEPATGARADAPQTFDVPTPVARVSDVHLRNARATLESQGKVFHIDIADTQLEAVNGAIDGVTNHIAGSIVIDGDAVAVGGALNPTFNQGTFEESYLCTENLAGPVR
jgi:hypothetical protein